MLDGIPGRIPSDQLLSPLLGLMVSRYPRGDAVSPTPGRQELHLHGDTVIKAAQRSIKIMEFIDFQDIYYRKDIGYEFQ